MNENICANWLEPWALVLAIRRWTLLLQASVSRAKHDGLSVTFSSCEHELGLADSTQASAYKLSDLCPCDHLWSDSGTEAVVKLHFLQNTFPTLLLRDVTLKAFKQLEGRGPAVGVRWTCENPGWVFVVSQQCRTVWGEFFSRGLQCVCACSPRPSLSLFQPQDVILAENGVCARACARVCPGWWAELAPVHQSNVRQVRGCERERERDGLGRRVSLKKRIKPARAPQFTHSSRATQFDTRTEAGTDSACFCSDAIHPNRLKMRFSEPCRRNRLCSWPGYKIHSFDYFLDSEVRTVRSSLLWKLDKMFNLRLKSLGDGNRPDRDRFYYYCCCLLLSLLL